MDFTDILYFVKTILLRRNPFSARKRVFDQLFPGEL